MKKVKNLQITSTECNFNSLPNDKFLDWTKFKAFAEKKLNVARMMISVLDKVENIVGEGENSRY